MSATALLQDEDPQGQLIHDSEHDHTPHSELDRLYFVYIPIGLILLCSLLCISRIIQMHCCKKQSEREAFREAQLNECSFNLSTLQRREILEIVFSKNNKAVTNCDFKKPPTNDSTKMEIDENKLEQHDVRTSIPAVTSVALTKEEQDDEELDLEAPIETTLPLTSDQNSAMPSTASSLIIPTVASSNHDEEMGVSDGDATVGSIHRSSCARQQHCTASQDTSGTKDKLDLTSTTCKAPTKLAFLANFKGVQEGREGEASKERESSSVIQAPPVADAIYPNCKSEDDDNCCAICLSDYEEGEVLIASKYCNHLFHKECILEWLEKHANCPSCRVDMVTTTELNEAASSLIGKTRMIKAMKCINNTSTTTRTSSARRCPSERRTNSTLVTPRGRMVPMGNIPRTFMRPGASS